jgi:AP-3 complex subunit delta-1
MRVGGWFGQTSTNNWMTIKLVRIFGQLAPLEPRLGKKLVDPLRQIMTTTPAKSLLYECIRTVTHGACSAAARLDAQGRHYAGPH